MATRRRSILNSFTKPQNGGEVRPIPIAQILTNDLYDYLTLEYTNTSTRDVAYGLFEVPSNYVDTASLRVVWTTTATTGNYDLEFDYRAIGGSDTESMDPTTNQESVGAVVAAPSATLERMVTDIALTDANFSAGDSVPFALARDGAEGDTIAASVVIISAHFEYDDGT